MSSKVPEHTTPVESSKQREERHIHILVENLEFITQNTRLGPTGLLNLMLERHVISSPEYEEILHTLDRHGEMRAVSALITGVCI